MTVRFDNEARGHLVDGFNECDYEYNGIPISEMTLKKVDCKFARQYIATFHYTKTMPDSSRFIYAGYLGDRLCGIVVYGMGCGKNQFTSVIPDIRKGEYVELTRLWCPNDMPKNTESKLISMSLKALPEEISLVISFSDASRGHCGIIYQATNWHYIGKNKGGKMLITNDGLEKHPRLLGIYRMRHEELNSLSNDEIMDILGYRVIEGGVKHKYVYLRGRKRRQMFNKYVKDKVLPYPKCDGAIVRSESEIVTQLREAGDAHRTCKANQLSLF